MKLLVVSTWCPEPPVNGSKLRAFHLIQALCRRHAVRLVTFAGPSDDPTAHALAAVCDGIDVAPGRPFLDGAPGWTGLFSAQPRSLVQAYSPAAAALIRERLRQCDAAVGLQMTVMPYLLNAERPYVAEEMELGWLWNAMHAGSARKRLRSRLTWWKTARFLRRVTREAAHTTVVSDVERSHLLRIGCPPDRVTVVPNGVSAADLDVREEAEPDTLVYAGATTYAANLDAVLYFVDAIYPIVCNARPHARLSVTGDSDARASARLHSSPGVILTGHLDDVRPAIARSRVAVVPLRQGGGTRIKVLQAMALGTPVVSTSKGVEGLGLRPGVDVLVADDPEPFAAHVVRLLDDDVLHGRLSANGRAVAAQRGWDRSGAALLDVLDHAMAARVG
ncbi:MAG: glycosyltransferase [Vicinamibacterales bacterium]